jgi:uncharacterized protein YjbI with pentapeptide repeats
VLGRRPEERRRWEREQGHDLNLRFANIPGASVARARLEDARLTGANLTGAHLEGADLTGAEGLTPEQMAGACVDTTTRLPTEIRPAP